MIQLQDPSTIKLEIIAGDPNTRTSVSKSIKYRKEHNTWPPNDNINAMRYLGNTRTTAKHKNRSSLRRVAYYTISALTFGLPQTIELHYYFLKKKLECKSDRAKNRLNPGITLSAAAGTVQYFGALSLYTSMLEHIIK